ncbi:MAG: hypothetical protein JWM47_3467 [Acidimicrobiales bacterium]|nr:hypothetical protein [Acidimicrobiales bacterium]
MPHTFHAPTRGTRRGATLLGSAALALSLVLTSCGAVKDKLEEKATEVGEAAAGAQGAGRARLADHPLSKDIDALAKKVGGKSLQVLSVTISELAVSASVQDPAKPKNVDSYTLAGDGTWGEPVPVDLVGSGTVEDSVFPAEGVAWDEIDGLAAEAPGKVDVEGGKFSNIRVARGFDGTVEISIYIDGTREDGNYTAGADGKNPKATKS